MNQADIDALPSELTIALDAPIEHWGKTYSELRLVEPTASQVKAFEGAGDIKAVTVCTDPALPEPVIAKLQVRKLKRATAFIGGFLQSATNGS